MYGKMQASKLTEFTPFTCTSAIWGQSCFLVHFASCFPPAPQKSLWSGGGVGVGSGSGSIPWIAVLGALIHIWRPEITDCCDISCLFIYRGYFHFTLQNEEILSYPSLF